MTKENNVIHRGTTRMVIELHYEGCQDKGIYDVIKDYSGWHGHLQDGSDPQEWAFFAANLRNPAFCSIISQS